MDVSIITNSLNMITDMQAKKPVTYRDHLDEFQKVFLKEMFTKQIVEGSFSEVTSDTLGLYDNTIAKQLMNELLTKQLVKQDALHIRSLLGHYVEDEDKRTRKQVRQGGNS